MNAEQCRILEACSRGAYDGSVSFPEIVGRLSATGVERYHADYTRGEITYYMADGDSHVVATSPEPHPAAETFSARDVAAAVGESQRGEHTYRDFLRKTLAAGCVGYFVLLTGRRVIYFGRKGESHTELFPGGGT